MPNVEWGWSELGDMPHGHGRMVCWQGWNGKVIVAAGSSSVHCFGGGKEYEGLWGCGVCTGCGNCRWRSELGACKNVDAEHGAKTNPLQALRQNQEV